MAATGQRIEITVDKKGVPSTHVFGVQGAGCTLATANYDTLFGDVLETNTTSDAYEDAEEIEIKNQQK